MPLWFVARDRNQKTLKYLTRIKFSFTRPLVKLVHTV